MLFRIAALLLAVGTLCSAATLKILVKDPSGALVPEAVVSLEPAAGGATLTATTDRTGVATFAPVQAGSYKMAVAAANFETAEQTVEISKDLELTVALKIAVVETALDVSGKRSALANAEPNYRALRDGRMTSAYSVKNLVLKRDAGMLTLKTGVMGFMAPVLGRSAVAVFSGDASFHLDPFYAGEKEHLRAVINKEAVDEDFESAVFYFTDRTLDEVGKACEKIEPPAQLADLLKRFHSRVRHRVEIPRSLAEALMFSSDMPNLDAELLAELYNPARLGTFTAFIRGKKYSDLRFIVKPRGALPDLPSPEEVALVNVDGAGEFDGIWYLSHTIEEWKQGTLSSLEVKRTVDAENYRIETTIGKNTHLASIADITLKPLESGERVIQFSLLPNLRVARVSLAGKEITFIQEGRRLDGAFYVILPEPLVKDQKITLKVEYEGDNVVRNSGGGSYSVGARTSWYPSINAFQQQAIYELIYKVPKGMTLVSVGKLVKEYKEGDALVSEWKTETPVAVAGFNYGQFKKKSVTDDTTHYTIEAYATSEVPDFLKNLGPFNMSPSAMAEQALVDAQNSIRVFTAWFGPAPYGRIAITQQPQFNFGQSWPTLVYLPVSAFLDSTQRWALMGGDAYRFAEFIQEVTPHEVAHQWWGHMVGWASYRDQWLSEGFADFSASLYLQLMEKKNDKFLQYWERGRKAILEKNEFGRSANDAGPLYMGFRLDTFKNQSAYRKLIYPKGGFVLHMLRYQMWDAKTGDQDFIDMMHDFVKSNLYKPASLESFMAVVDRHMKPGLDLEQNGRSTWFFREWVMGNEVPKYRLEYTLEKAEQGWLLKGKTTQSGVSDDFKMRVPLYGDFDGRMVRMGSVPVFGSQTSPEFKVMLPKKPKRVVINANQDILAHESVSKEM